MKKAYLLIVLGLSVFYILGCKGETRLVKDAKVNNIENVDITAATIPVIESDFTLLESKKMDAIKEAIQNGDKQFVPAYAKLMRDADTSLEAGTFSVTYKTLTPPSGNKHDYLSLAPYWWPDPEKEDGLPWLRKDGEINPMTRNENVDEPTKDKMMGAVRNLSLAYFFSDDVRYAEKTKELLNVWFLDEKTKMNPNLNYAQGVPGRSEGRGFGVIEFASISNIITALEILKLNNQLDNAMASGMNAWLTAYLDWLQTSELGIFEKTRKNNHGTLYDVQVVSLLLFLNRTSEAKQLLETVVANRILPHIAADGSQQRELERTKALTYSILNLSGLTKLAFLARKKNVEITIWEMESSNGDLKKAHDYLQPFLEVKNVFPYEQLGSMEDAIAKLQGMFRNTGSMLDIPTYCTISSELKDKDHLDRLRYPCNL